MIKYINYEEPPPLPDQSIPQRPRGAPILAFHDGDLLRSHRRSASFQGGSRKTSRGLGFHHQARLRSVLRITALKIFPIGT
jgi:hypothetical protein